MAAWPGSIGYVNSVDEIVSADRSGLYEFAKRCTDCILAGILLVMLSPLMAVCMLIIRSSSRGPAVIRQQRLGKNGRLFSMLKLRTMTVDAEAASDPVLATANDSRIVPACRWMRRSHVDELPQLINVLRGDMSLVGPRPERPEIAMQIYTDLPEFRHRLQVRPGITGLAQVRNGYDTCKEAVRRKLHYDLEYIRRRSWLLELGILLTTLTKIYDSSAR